MGPISETKASLRVFGDGLDPDEITRLLGKEPTRVRVKGKKFRNEGTGREFVARHSGWWLASRKRTPGDLDGQVREILDGLTEDLSIWADLTARYRIDLFCGLFMESGNEGEVLSPDTLRELGARGIPIDLDIYGPE